MCIRLYNIFCAVFNFCVKLWAWFLIKLWNIYLYLFLCSKLEPVVSIDFFSGHQVVSFFYLGNNFTAWCKQNICSYIALLQCWKENKFINEPSQLDQTKSKLITLIQFWNIQFWMLVAPRHKQDFDTCTLGAHFLRPMLMCCIARWAACCYRGRARRVSAMYDLTLSMCKCIFWDVVVGRHDLRAEICIVVHERCWGLSF